MDLSYPIGKYDWQAPVNAEMRPQLVVQIAQAPARFREAVRGLDDRQLDTPYRSGGWTVRQVVHHVADSHMNSYIRFRLALTEEIPTIKPYDQEKWAGLPDTRMPVEASLQLLDGLHARWAALLGTMSDADFGRTFRHPEMDRLLRLDTTLGLYAWHGRHHEAHITNLRERMGWK